MDWINYHHLLHFWVVAREGSVVRACGELQLDEPIDLVCHEGKHEHLVAAPGNRRQVSRTTRF